jgi:hypothetical protein
MRMSRLVLRAALRAVALGLVASGAAAQAPPSTSDSSEVPPLFEKETPLTIALIADLPRLRADKDTNSPWRHATITYASDTGRVVVRARARTRGIWRLKNCAFPPLRLSFSGKDTKGTLFHHLGKPKLVNYCKDTDAYEQYILQEFQLYRIYQLLTPVSYRVRLLRVAYVDSATGKADATRYAFIAEDPERLAKRFNGKVLKMKGATAADFEPEPLALAYLFEFMIGNTDFSFNGLHNTQLIGTNDGRILPVAYDFDYAGAVNTVYATPDPQFRIRHVRDRRFRGYCAIAAEYPKLLPLFREKKAAIYALYRDEIGRLLSPGVVRETLEYFDEFYEMIATPASAQSSFLDGCVGPR